MKICEIKGIRRRNPNIESDSWLSFGDLVIKFLS
jgi:hypothetical protein